MALIAVLIICPLASGQSERSGSGAANCSQPELARRFQRASEALQSGSLDVAEQGFQSVLRCGPNAGAYANLGVVYMRRKDWAAATRALNQAARLAPSMTGVRLNLALIAFHQAKYEDAVPYLKTIVREQPTAVQPSYLLGLSYFFTQQYAPATTILHPLWSSLNNDLAYLYVVGLAADKARETQISEAAWGRLAEIGANTAQFHLLMGKADYNRGDPDKAIPEFQAAEKIDPALPFLHYNWGRAYVFINQYEEAKAEFLKDIAVEPEIPYNYEELGRVYDKLGDDVLAEQNFQKALKLDSQLPGSYFELAKIYERRGQIDQALKAVDSALALDSESNNLHYLRARLLQRMGKKAEAKSEFAEAKHLLDKHRGEDTLERQLANPELSFQSK
jgi:tetratricopeptide (TPR) repeat protein